MVLAGLVATAVLLYYPVRMLQDHALRRSALAQARKSYEDGHIDKALMGLDGYLETWPGDLDGLELKGELAAKVAFSPPQMLQGIQALDALLRLDPRRAGPPG